MKSLREVMDGMDWSEWSSTPRCMQKVADGGEVCDNVSGAVVRREVPMEETTAERLLREEREAAREMVRKAAEPTTAELFETVRAEMDTLDVAADDNDLPLLRTAANVTRESLALLERRMGAVMRAASDVLSAGSDPLLSIAALRDLESALTDAPAVVTPSVPAELAMLIDAFADEVKTAEDYATRPKGGQQVTPSGDFIRCTPSMLGRLRWWANALKEGRTAVPVFTLEEVREAVLFRTSSPDDADAVEGILKNMRGGR